MKRNNFKQLLNASNPFEDNEQLKQKNFLKPFLLILEWKSSYDISIGMCAKSQ